MEVANYSRALWRIGRVECCERKKGNRSKAPKGNSRHPRQGCVMGEGQLVYVWLSSAGHFASLTATPPGPILLFLFMLQFLLPPPDTLQSTFDLLDARPCPFDWNPRSLRSKLHSICRIHHIHHIHHIHSILRSILRSFLRSSLRSFFCRLSVVYGIEADRLASTSVHVHPVHPVNRPYGIDGWTILGPGRSWNVSS